jgi:Zn/Cd-binding protein ZinT
MLAGCSSHPEDTVEKFYKAVAANHAEEAVSYFSFKDVKENDLTAVKGKMQMVVGAEYAAIQQQGGLDSVTSRVVKQDKDSAEGEVTMNFKNGQTQTKTDTLTKEGGDWKFDLGRK